MNTVRRGQNLPLIDIWHGHGNRSKLQTPDLHSWPLSDILSQLDQFKVCGLAKKYHDSNYFFHNFIAYSFVNKPAKTEKV